MDKIYKPLQEIGEIDWTPLFDDFQERVDKINEVRWDVLHRVAERTVQSFVGFDVLFSSVQND